MNVLHVFADYLILNIDIIVNFLPCLDFSNLIIIDSLRNYRS